MKVPYSWLRDYVDVEVDARRLGEALTLVGLALEGLEGEGDEAILDLEVTTNRVDCMNVYGVAREVSVIYGLPLKPLAVGVAEHGSPAAESLAVVIEAPDLCSRFCARVLDVRLGPSPPWIRKRLEQVGVRPISNLVDLTNYVMMEMGQPTHAFDLGRIPTGKLSVRWARAGERVTTLDGVERMLDAQVPIGVVAGPEAPLALAGIMGGASSEVGDTTTVVALEAASWEPRVIRRAARALGMHTEASHRFERGADPEGAPLSLARISHLLEQTGAGTSRPGLIECQPSPPATVRISLRPARLETVLGTSVPEDRTRQILMGLGFRVGPWAAGRAEIEVPTWRGDVSREIDLIEEVGRHHGLDKIETALPPSAEALGLSDSQKRRRRIGAILVAAGFTEVINQAFAQVSTPGFDVEPAVALANPLAEDQSALRRSLLPGLLANLKTNLRQQRRDVALFEMGRVFMPAKGLPLEECRLGLLLVGHGWPGRRPERRQAADVFDLKGALELLMRRLGLGDFGLAIQERLPAYIHPDEGALVTVSGEVIGCYGALHPDVRADQSLPDETFVAELSLDTLLERPTPPVRVEPLDRFPAVERDLSVLCDASDRAAAIEDVIRKSGGERLRSVLVVDHYDKPPTVPTGKVSLTLSLRFQDRSRTLSGEEVEAAVENVARELRAVGVEIRGE